MRTFPPAAIRNVAFVGHAGAGKTSLVEALLVETGAIGRAGRVEDGSTVTDHEPEERARGRSLSTSLAATTWKGHKLNLLDGPGSPDFEHEVDAALAIADLAVLVVSAADPVSDQVRSLWRRAAALRLPRMVFVNQLDRDRSSFDAALDELRESFGAGVAPLELPIGAEGAFHGVADLLSDTAFLYDGPTPTRGPIPEEMVDREHAVHDALVEGIVVGDDALLERYLAGETPTVAELEAALAVGVDDATVFPVVCGSATAHLGIDRLADLLCEIGPSPLDRPAVEVAAGDGTAPVAPDTDGPALAVVARTIADPFVGQVSLLRCLSGSLRPDTHLRNSRTGADERLHGLFTLLGSAHVEVDEVPAGDLAAVAKLADTATGDTLSAAGLPVVVPWPVPPDPVAEVAVAAASPADEDKLAVALQRLLAEDPALRLWRDDETHQTVLAGQGDVHLAVALERLARKHGIEVATAPVAVAHRETVTATGRAEGRLKKQSGGHGQFAVVTLQVEPLERGAGFEFVDEVVGGAIPRSLVPAVEKGVVEAMAEGGALGLPVVDVRVRCLDGRHHPVDSSEMAFKAAARLALRDALAAAGPVVLEPVSVVEVTTPDDLQGEVMGDLSARRGRVRGTELGDDHEVVVSAVVPTGELGRYAAELRSLTGGRARFRARPDHYDVLPGHLATAVITEPA